MTAIAWDGKTLAADSYVYAGNVISYRNAMKIKRLKNGNLAGASGDYSAALEFLEWAEEKKKDEYPKGDINGLIVLKKTGWVEKYDLGFSGFQKGFWAIGAGFELCMGAMASGATALEAVYIATKYHILCGGRVKTLTL